MTLTKIKPARQLAALRMNGVAGVRRAANRGQLLDENGNPADGWALMKSDGTPVDLDEYLLTGLTAEQRADKAEAALATARAELKVLKAAAVPATKSQAFARIEKAADVLRTTETGLTREQAICRVTELEPELAEQYRDAPLDPVVATPVLKAAPPAGQEYVDAIDLQVLAVVAKSDDVSTSQAYRQVLASREGQRLREAYYAIAFGR